MLYAEKYALSNDTVESTGAHVKKTRLHHIISVEENYAINGTKTSQYKHLITKIDMTEDITDKKFLLIMPYFRYSLYMNMFDGGTPNIISLKLFKHKQCGCFLLLNITCNFFLSSVYEDKML